MVKIFFFILFLISIQFFLGYTEKLIEELNMAYTSLFEISNFFDLESYKIIFLLAGNRLFYLLASLNSSIINLVFGHGFLSSSAIYTSKILDVTENLGFSTASLFAKSFIMGAKPHSSFGFIIFTNGFLGLFILFK